MCLSFPNDAFVPYVLEIGNEFVAAKPSCQIRGTYHALDEFRKADEDAVSDVMPINVIDELEEINRLDDYE